MPSMIPVSAWAKIHGISRDLALTMVRRGKIPGARLKKVLNEWWYVPVDALPDLTDRRTKEARKRGGASSRSA